MHKLLGLTLAFTLLSASAASAQTTGGPAPKNTKNGITALSPKPGSSVKRGAAPTFRMRVVGPGPVYVHVCRSAKRNSKGLICSRSSMGRAVRRGSEMRYRPRFYDFPSFWLNRRGTYYWQAHRIHCAGDNTSDCRQEGAIVRFRVR